MLKLFPIWSVGVPASCLLCPFDTCPSFFKVLSYSPAQHVFQVCLVLFLPCAGGLPPWVSSSSNTPCQDSFMSQLLQWIFNFKNHISISKSSLIFLSFLLLLHSLPFFFPLWIECCFHSMEAIFLLSFWWHSSSFINSFLFLHCFSFFCMSLLVLTSLSFLQQNHLMVLSQCFCIRMGHQEANWNLGLGTEMPDKM